MRVPGQRRIRHAESRGEERLARRAQAHDGGAAVLPPRRRRHDPHVLRGPGGGVAARMIRLYQFPTAYGIENLSPFCMKVEVWLKLAGLDYEIKWTFNPGKGPKGKLPFIKDGNKIVADSQDIIAHLSRAYGIDLDANLDADQRATAHAFRRMLEESTYWALVHFRWIDPATWPKTREGLFGSLPPGVRSLVPRLAQRKIARDLHGQGTSRHPPGEILARATHHLSAIDRER